MDTEIQQKRRYMEDLRKYLGEVLRELARRKECEILEAHAMPNHAHMLISLPPMYVVSQVVGFMKGKARFTLGGDFLSKEESYSRKKGHSGGFTMEVFGAKYPNRL
jgi:putative transposase